VKKTEIKPMFDFLLYATKLKKIPRSGWVKKVGVKNPESVAGHTFGLALCCMLFSDVRGLNTEKVLKMALLHDLIELKIGDLMPKEKLKLGVELKEKEEKAMIEILSRLPEKLRKEYHDLWIEFKDQETREAKLVNDLDLIEMGIQALDYEREGYPKGKLDEFWETIENSISEEYLFKILKQMRGG